MKNKILYVEDEPFLSKVVKETLEHQGFDVLHCADGSYVLQKIETYQPDVCVLDVMLPSIDGFTLGRTIRSKYPDLPFIFLTAKSFTEDVVTGFKTGANDYIRKPFSIEELIVRIQNQLQNLKVKTDSVQLVTTELKIGKARFYPGKLELIIEKNVIKLSNRENQILEILYANKSTITSRKELLLLVWGDDSYYNSRNLDVYIHKLRTYFSKDQVEILTLRGAGYLFQINAY